MTTTEIKKLLYKKEHTASLVRIKKGLIYHCTILHPDKDLVGLLVFKVPYDDIGDAEFSLEMEAKLLICYLQPGDPFTS